MARGAEKDEAALGVDHSEAIQYLADFINRLRDKGVRSFKGELLAPDGAKLWNLEIHFERKQEQRDE